MTVSSVMTEITDQDGASVKWAGSSAAETCPAVSCCPARPCLRASCATSTLRRTMRPRCRSRPTSDDQCGGHAGGLTYFLPVVEGLTPDGPSSVTERPLPDARPTSASGASRKQVADRGLRPSWVVSGLLRRGRARTFCVRPNPAAGARHGETHKPTLFSRLTNRNRRNLPPGLYGLRPFP